MKNWTASGVALAGLAITPASAAILCSLDRVSHFIGNNATTIQSLLQGQPAWLGPLPFNNAIDRNLWNLAPTIDFGGRNGFNLRLGGQYQFSNHLHMGSLTVQMSQQVGRKPKSTPPLP